jgi:hypothetical protein
MKLLGARNSGWVLSALSLFLLSGCELTPQEQKAIQYSLDATEPGPTPSPLSSVIPGEPVCYNERHFQPEADVIRKVDLLLIFDTSGSMDQDRRNVAEGLDDFVQAIPDGTDYRVAVMLAHGSSSQHSGRLYKYKNNREVLSSEDMSLEEIRTQLKSNMINAPSGSQTSGEAS